VLEGNNDLYEKDLCNKCGFYRVSGHGHIILSPIKGTESTITPIMHANVMIWSEVWVVIM
jgi:hypothetical protein